MAKFDYPIIVIGAGAGGLVVAAGAAKAGKKVLLIERGIWGGDCTNYGCIPSKTLIASAHAAHAIRSAEHLGIKAESTEFDATLALDRVREVVERVRRHEEPEALRKMGIEIVEGIASFEDCHTVKVGDRRFTGKNIVIATGSYPVIPPIEGLKDVPYLCNENIFELTEIPSHLAVLGGGPIGCELGQAFLRLGSKVTLIEAQKMLLPREEVITQQTILQVFRQEGMDVRLRSTVKHVSQEGKELVLDVDGEQLRTSHLLVSVGRAPHLEELNLEATGIAFERQGIPTDSYGRTSCKTIWAIGDASLNAPFTHMAEFVGREVLTSILIPGPFKKRHDRFQVVPRVTYLDPEVAAAGLSESEAIEKYGEKKIAVYQIPFSEVDRAITTGREEGFVRVVTRKWSSAILGVTIVAPRAGEMIGEVTLAMHYNIPFRNLATLIHPYPSYSLAIRQAADRWLSETLLRNK